MNPVIVTLASCTSLFIAIIAISYHRITSGRFREYIEHKDSADIMARRAKLITEPDPVRSIPGQTAYNRTTINPARHIKKRSNKPTKDWATKELFTLGPTSRGLLMKTHWRPLTQLNGKFYTKLQWNTLVKYCNDSKPKEEKPVEPLPTVRVEEEYTERME